MAADAFAYLENSNDGRARAWITTRNNRTSAELEGDSRFQRYFQAVLAGETCDAAAGVAISPLGAGFGSIQDGDGNLVAHIWHIDVAERSTWRWPGQAASASGRARLDALIYTHLARELLDRAVDSR